ncbi:hypothetical protein C1H46_013547 [Malus baccata]|uniref:Uncharacterized protein n=1 Tax=Malus baccata TaxID=106549 RepID=A0A540MPW4_MALBA|nr:hypothetical protein C1H46_013547 [Malus baccata]
MRLMKAKRGEAEGSRKKEVMGSVDEECLNKLLQIVKWDSPEAVCMEMAGLIGECVLKQYEEAQSSDDEIVNCPSKEGDCDIFTLKVIEFLSCGLSLDRITPTNIPNNPLRMAIDMLHGLHNV